MNNDKIKKQHQFQHNLLQSVLKDIRNKTFVYNGNDDNERIQAKINFLNVLKSWLEKAFCFNNYQAEFVVNEAINRVLKHSNENMLVFYDTKKAEKLVKTSFVLGHHYFRFIMTIL